MHIGPVFPGPVTNEVAVQTLKIVGCFLHTIDRVGKHFSMPNLSEFMISWINLFSHSPKTRQDQTGKSMATHSATR